MNFEKEIANMLAENIKSFVEYVHLSYLRNNSYLSNPDKLYRLKLLLDEFQFCVIADELLRINRFIFDDKYTSILVNEFRNGLQIIGEFIEYNYNDLFIFSARLHTLRSINSAFTQV